jgi:hypothetical protein
MSFKINREVRDTAGILAKEAKVEKRIWFTSRCGTAELPHQ